MLNFVAAGRISFNEEKEILEHRVYCILILTGKSPEPFYSSWSNDQQCK